MFSKIRAQLNGIQLELHAIGASLRRAVDVLQESPGPGADADRLNEIERRLEVIMGEVDAGLIRGEALKQTALAAEDRARNHSKRAEVHAKLVEELEGGEDEDSFETVGRAYAKLLPSGNDAGGEDVPPVPAGLDARREGLAMVRAAKRGR